MKKEIKIINGTLHYNETNLLDLAKEYGTPLKVTFLDVIKNRIETLKNAFNKVISEESYKGKFIYLNANKANYAKEEIYEAYLHSDGLETSSYYDLLLTKDIMNLNKDMLNKYIVCNGIKKNDYITEIKNLSESNMNIITIIDSKEEYLEYKKLSVNKKLNVGIRIHLKSLYEEEGAVIHNDRFGVTDEEFEFIINDMKNQNNMMLTTIHFHQRGFDFEEDKFKLNIRKSFNYYINASKQYDTLCNFDIGGGTPLKVNSDFDYEYFAKALISTVKEMCEENNIKHPNIISENGKYSQKDSTINIYEIVSVKNTDKTPWYVVDGSLLIAMPEMYALGEEIILSPVNDLDKPMVKCFLGGLTCDCDDVYYEKDKGHFLMPIQGDNKLYVCILGTGSYQNSMNGKGGVHHCLLPEEKDIVIKTIDGKKTIYVRNELQTIEDIKRLMKF